MLKTAIVHLGADEDGQEEEGGDFQGGGLGDCRGAMGVKENAVVVCLEYIETSRYSFIRSDHEVGEEGEENSLSVVDDEETGELCEPGNRRVFGWVVMNLPGSWTTAIREILPAYSQMNLLEAGLGQLS